MAVLCLPAAASPSASAVPTASMPAITAIIVWRIFIREFFPGYRRKLARLYRKSHSRRRRAGGESLCSMAAGENARRGECQHTDLTDGDCHVDPIALCMQERQQR